MREERNSINHRHPLLAAAFEEEQRRRPRRRSPPKRAVARPVSFGDLTEVARREEREAEAVWEAFCAGPATPSTGKSRSRLSPPYPPSFSSQPAWPPAPPSPPPTAPTLDDGDDDDAASVVSDHMRRKNAAIERLAAEATAARVEAEAAERRSSAALDTATAEHRREVQILRLRAEEAAHERRAERHAEERERALENAGQKSRVVRVVLRGARLLHELVGRGVADHDEPPWLPVVVRRVQGAEESMLLQQRVGLRARHSQTLQAHGWTAVGTHTSRARSVRSA